MPRHRQRRRHCSPESSSRSRSRSPAPELATHDVLSFGRHQGQTYREVFRHFPDYCRWALHVRNPSGPLRHFARWCRQQQRGRHAGSLPGDLLGLSDVDSSDYGDHLEGPEDAAGLSDSDTSTVAIPLVRQRQQQVRPGTLQLQRATIRPAHEVLDLLPRVAFDPQLFNGNPHPDSCPICMEDFEEGRQIVLTPCLHVFHLQCLQGWLTKKKECPSCRWDVTDTGEQKAFCNSHAAAPVAVLPDAALVFAPGQAIELSDDEFD